MKKQPCSERMRSMHIIQRGVFADEVAQLEAEVERLQECVLEAYRIHNEAHPQADHYAYDLMRTVMRPLEDEVGCYPLIENALLERSE